MDNDDFKEDTLTCVYFYKNNFLTIFWLYILVYHFDTIFWCITLIQEKKGNSEDFDPSILHIQFFKN